MIKNRYIKPSGSANLSSTRVNKIIKDRQFLTEEDYEENEEKIKNTIEKIDEKVEEIKETSDKKVEDFDTLKEYVDSAIKNIDEMYDKIRDEKLYEVKNNIINYINEYDEKLSEEINSYLNNLIKFYLYRKRNYINKSKEEDERKKVKKILNKNGDTIILYDDGSLKVKGINKYGELGLGTEENINDFSNINLDFKVSDIEINEDNILIKDEYENKYKSGIINQYNKVINVENINKFIIDQNFYNTNDFTILDNNKYIFTNPYFYNDKKGIKIISITKECSKMSFYYKTNGNNYYYNAIYLYIDGKYYERYNYGGWTSIEILVATGKHEFTWVLYSYDDNYYSCIDTISFNDELETNKDNFKCNGILPIADIPTEDTYYKDNNTPFYNKEEGFKVVSITKECSKMSFYYKTYNSNYGYNAIYLYIDGKYYNRYCNTSWTFVEITESDITDGKHEFTWVLYNYDNTYYSCIDTISFNDEIETNKDNFNYNSNCELIKLYYQYNTNTTCFYNNESGIKIVSITKECSKMSFYYKTNGSYNTSNAIYLYIDGEYYNYYCNTSWTSVEITESDITDGKHEFTWVLYNNNNNTDYSCIDTISFNDVVETDKNNFTNISNYELINNKNYSNGLKSTTPFYNKKGINVISITKECSKMSFYYKNYYNNNQYNAIYLYIDGKYYNRYCNSSWTSVEIPVTNDKHEFTWILYRYNSAINDYYSCIDTISFNDVVETNKNNFSNSSNYELINNKDYSNGLKSTTPFYNNTVGIKIVSITKECSKMSFYYKTYDSIYYYNAIYLYIDGKYYNRYNYGGWTSIEIPESVITDGKHEFTWVLYSYSGSCYSCIDTISFNDVVEKDVNNFNYSSNYELINIKDYSNGINSTIPFYNKDNGIKIVSITKECSKMSFYYKTYISNYYNNAIYLYIDGEYYNRYYTSGSWTSVEIPVTDGKHEFTWVLYSYGNYDSNICYSCIDTISFNNIEEIDVNNFSINYTKEIDNKFYINGLNSTTPFYNNTIGIKIVSITKECSKMSFYYKTIYNSDNNAIYLYIDGNYYNRYYSSNAWSSVEIPITTGKHEFTWVLYSYNSGYYSCIDTISFDEFVYKRIKKEYYIKNGKEYIINKIRFNKSNLYEYINKSNIFTKID